MTLKTSTLLPVGGALYAGDILWDLMLNELRDYSYGLTPLVRQLTGYQGAIVRQEYESILCKMDDLIELARVIESRPTHECITSLQQIAADVSESYLRRFGLQASEKFTLLVDEKLPVVTADPQLLMRIIDCLARGGRIAGRPRRNELEIKYALREDNNLKRVTLSILSTDVPFACPPSRRPEILEMVNAGNYLFAVKDFGIELCCAFHLTRKAGGIVTLDVNDRERAVVKLEMDFNYVGEAPFAISIPQKVLLYTQSPDISKHFESMAHLHKFELHQLSTPESPPDQNLLIFDAINLRREDYKNLQALNCERTLLLLGSNDRSDLTSIQEFGYQNYTRVPLVSSRILQILSKMNDSSSKVTVSESSAQKQQILNVLLIDDTETARIFVREHLLACGHRVEELSDGTELLERIREGHKYDLIICDVAMCHMDGITAVKRLREHEAGTGRHTPVALMTAYPATEPALRDKCYDWLLSKPVSQAELQKIFDQINSKTSDRKQRKTHSIQVQPTTEVIVLDDLRQRCGGRTLTMTKMLASFIESSQSFLPKLHDQTSNDEVMLARTLHALKGLLREVSAQSGALMVESLEQQVKEGAAISKQDLNELANVVTRACDKAKEIRDQLRSLG